MKITIRITSVYGRETIYPVDEQARLFTALTGKKTLSRYDLDTIKALGYSVEVEAPTL